MFTLQKAFKRQKSYFCTTAATISVDKLLQPREMTKETHKRTNFSQKFFACLFFLPEKCFRTAAVGGSVGAAGNTLCDTCTDTNRHTRRVKIEEVGLSAGEWEREREKKRDICLPYTNTHSLPLTDWTVCVCVSAGTRRYQRCFYLFIYLIQLLQSCFTPADVIT